MKNFNRGGRELPIEQPHPVTTCNIKFTAIILPMIIFCVLFSVPDLLGTSALAQSQHRDKGPLASPAYGQEADGLNTVKPVTIGDKMPNEFWTKEHLFYVNGDTVRKTLEEYRGKLLVLDFYMSGCAMCVAHQKEISYFKKEYPGQIEVLMVNSNITTEKYERINRLYKAGHFERAGTKDFVSIIEDSYLEKLFPYKTFPSYFWINEFGVLQTHTYRNYLDRNYKPPFLNKI